VLNACDLTIGALEEKARRAEAVDRTFVGRLAAFASVPARVRSIVAEDHPGLGKLAFSVGVFGQIIIGIVSGLILTAGTVGVTAAWKAVVGPAAVGIAPSPSPSPSPVAPTSAAVPTPRPAPSGR
jgi:hypothetical protein